MSKIVAVHSYKGGTGKTLISVNLAATFAKQGKKVAILDFDFRAPSLFALLRCEETSVWLNEKTGVWLNDYLNSKCEINKVLVELSSRVSGNGKLYVGLADPSMAATRDISTKDRRWEMRALSHLLSLKNTLIDEQKFDYVLLDTSPGLHFSSMNALVTADFVVVTTTGDYSDVNGTKLMLSEFYKMFEKKTGLIINKVLDEEARTSNVDYVKKIRETYKVPLLSAVPCFCEILKTGGRCIFPQDRPDHPFTGLLSEMATKIERNDVN